MDFDSLRQTILKRSKRRVSEDRRDCYWLYVVTGCKSQPNLQEPIKNPAWPVAGAWPVPGRCLTCLNCLT